MSTKREPGKFDCYAELGPDEPYFLLMGRDPVGSYFAAAWAHLRAGDTEKAMRNLLAARQELELSGEALLPKDSEKYLEALDCADTMFTWYRGLADECAGQGLPGASDELGKR